jgi:hypothetical protein
LLISNERYFKGSPKLIHFYPKIHSYNLFQTLICIYIYDLNIKIAIKMSNSESESKQIIFEETIRSNRRARRRRIREKKRKKI